MIPAIFLDRDGTLNESIYDISRQVERAPWSVSELKLKPFVIDSLRRLQKRYNLFLVTNQPDASRGLVGMGSLMEIKCRLMNLMLLNDINFRCYYYCFHKSEDFCKCRKPSPHFLFKAAEDYHIDLKNSFMVGDSDKDIGCGKNAGVKTILIMNNKKYEGIEPDYRVKDIKEAVDLILSK